MQRDATEFFVALLFCIFPVLLPCIIHYFLPALNFSPFSFQWMTFRSSHEGRSFFLFCLSVSNSLPSNSQNWSIQLKPCLYTADWNSSDLRDICRAEMWWRIEIHLLWMSRKRDHSLGHVIQCERFFFVNERFRSWDGGHHCRKSDTSNSPSCTSCHCKVRLVICVMLPCSTSSCFLLNPKP